MPADFKHPEYKKRIKTWTDVDNVVNKENLHDYLRTLNPSDHREDNKKRNQVYAEHAIFYNFTGYTLSGLTGEVFSENPKCELPPELEYLKENADGMGNGLDQIAQASVREVSKKARSGLFVSFPFLDRAISRADIQAGVRATISPIDAKRIINWRESLINGVMKLSLVVIESSEQEIAEDGFGTSQRQIFRALVLIDNVFHDQKWWKVDDTWFSEDRIPTDGSGSVFNEIPFYFIGSVNNDSKVDTVDMSDLADINIGHYRNSADYEDSVWFAGQSQPWMSGVDEHHIELIKNNNLYTGSRSLMPVPAGEQFGYASAVPNPLVRQAMIDKFELARSLGARFVQSDGANKTAFQAAGEMKVGHSILGLIASNVGDAYVQAIHAAGKYMNANTDNIEYKLKSEFLPQNATAQDAQVMVDSWMKGAVPIADHFNNMRRIGYIDREKTLEEFLDEMPANAFTE